MNSIQIGISLFGFWLAIVAPMAAMVWQFRRESREELKEQRIELQEQRLHWSAEMQEQRTHWAELLKSFCDFKNVTVERFTKLEGGDKK